MVKELIDNEGMTDSEFIDKLDEVLKESSKDGGSQICIKGIYTSCPGQWPCMFGYNCPVT